MTPDAGAPAAANVPSWTSAYFIQIAQNLTTGAFVSLVCWLAWYWVARGDLPAWWPAAVGTVGVVWAAAWTITRFHADEVGLVRFWYRLGQKSRDAEVNGLYLELETLRDAVTAAGDVAPSSQVEKHLAVKQATLRNARTLLRVVYEHGPEYATRQKMDSLAHMGQRDWERVRRLCQAAGVIDQYMQPLAPTLRDAVVLTEQLHAAGMEQLRSGKPGRTGVAWL